MNDPNPQAVLAQYPGLHINGAIEWLGGAGGFSGARFWRVPTAAGLLCLRRWPQEYPSGENLAIIHQVLDHVSGRGFRRVPEPLRSRAGATFVAAEGHLWELTPWLPGTADFRQDPNAERLREAMRTLAAFHQAAADCPMRASARHGPAPGIAHRHQLLLRMIHGGADRLELAVRPTPAPELVPLARRILRLFRERAGNLNAQLVSLLGLGVPLQVCLGDVWHDHVLFVGNRVSGLIDFGTVRWESVTADVARLLGSLVSNRQVLWQEGLVAYSRVRPLSAAEQVLVDAYDRSGVLLAGINWIDWIYAQGRTFEDWNNVRKRMEMILAGLEVQPATVG